MTDNQKEFLLKEYDKLNSEVAKLLEETRTREKYSLTIISLVAAWIYTEIIKLPSDICIGQNSFIHIIHILSWIPLVITLLYGLSVFLIYKNINWIGSYLSKTESIFIDNLKDDRGEIFGWEKYFNKENRKRHFVIWTYLFWILQFIMSLMIVYMCYSIR